ncbi:MULTISPECIES: DUF3626 domain-containing protein [unclassified Streptomyces]|uniref:DUF3626 domain-containing protein n=1 Tax=unclassified Streptomyces TaxID=2593676 RepID=UPI0006F527EE|nr:MULTISPECIES: DUF3626 domain-containing protein [unclassified Streptomyces]KQX49908.1 hypothetical protein ASD33_14765 [Streptomyces sp. Root1304]KRA80049.1 hypothetical protein ASE09_18145 [Streptomyces sp. Root66D1]
MTTNPPGAPEPGTPHARALAHVAARADGEPLDPSLRVTLNFHPHFLPLLADDGVYRSQFVTGTSNGGLTAHPGGDRHRWESRIFGAAYDHAPADSRPVYGALNFRRRPFGAAPRFGSAHLRLSAAGLQRATFCYPDSFLEPTDFGVASRMSLIALAEADEQDPLDDYIEAQIHGPVVIARDVEALVLDPSHRGTEVEAAARRLPCAVEWHGGFRLSVDVLREHPDFRGAQYVELGARIAVDGWLDPRIVQDAAGSGRYDPQDVKRVWHYLARFGAPVAAPAVD